MLPRRSVSYRLFVIAAMASRLLAAESVELPAELPLDSAAVAIELWNADVEVLADPAAKPVLLARGADGEPAEGGLVAVVVDGVLEIRRPAGEDFRLKVTMVAGAEQQVRLAGRDLSVVTRESQQPGVTAPPGLHLSLDSSELDMEGGRDAVVEARESAVWLARTRGSLSVTLTSGAAEIRAHEGDVKLESTGAEVTLIDPMGNVEPLLRGGNLDVRGGAGSIAGEATDAVLVFDGWSGRLSLTGAGATLEARGADGPQPWELAGEDLQVTLERSAAAVTARLNGGRFQAYSMSGSMDVTAATGADVELTDLAQGAVLKLSEEATARLTGVAGDVRAEVNDAQLRAEEVQRLVLTGARSKIYASRIENVAKVEMSDSELELDLRRIERDASLSLLGTGRAQVRLSTPCRVRIDGPRAPASDQLDVSGCELRLPGQPRSSAKAHLIYGSFRPVTLAVTLEEGVELEVEGMAAD